LINSGESLFDQLEFIKEKIMKENEEEIQNLDEVQQFYYYQNVARKTIDPHESLKKKLNTLEFIESEISLEENLLGDIEIEEGDS
jgi:hypothetical protein